MADSSTQVHRRFGTRGRQKRIRKADNNAISLDDNGRNTKPSMKQIRLAVSGSVSTLFDQR